MNRRLAAIIRIVKRRNSISLLDTIVNRPVYFRFVDPILVRCLACRTESGKASSLERLTVVVSSSNSKSCLLSGDETVQSCTNVHSLTPVTCRFPSTQHHVGFYREVALLLMIEHFALSTSLFTGRFPESTRSSSPLWS